MYVFGGRLKIDNNIFVSILKKNKIIYTFMKHMYKENYSFTPVHDSYSLFYSHIYSDVNCQYFKNAHILTTKNKAKIQN